MINLILNIAVVVNAMTKLVPVLFVHHVIFARNSNHHGPTAAVQTSLNFVKTNPKSVVKRNLSAKKRNVKHPRNPRNPAILHHPSLNHLDLNHPALNHLDLNHLDLNHPDPNHLDLNHLNLEEEVRAETEKEVRVEIEKMTVVAEAVIIDVVTAPVVNNVAAKNAVNSPRPVF
jgi:hypothetical protein